MTLRMMTWPQFEIGVVSIERSSGFEEKLDPDERDSQSVCDVVLQAFGFWPSAVVRLTPNSANCPATRAWPLIPFPDGWYAAC